MPVLVDGNNVAHRLEADRGSREALRRRILAGARRSRMQVEIVFDGAPPLGVPEVERLGRVTVRYAGPATADDVIVARLPAGGRAREWTVVTDDRGLAARVRARGARVEGAAPFLRRLGPAPTPGEKPETPSAEEIAELLAAFGAADPGEERPPE